MIESTVFSQVELLAGRSGDRESGSAIGLIIGYAKLISMNSGVLEALFKSEKERADLQGIRDVMAENGIDVILLKQCAGILNNRTSSADSEELRMVLRKYEAEPGESSAAEILRDLMRLNIPELQLVKQGHKLEDVFAYLNNERERERGAGSSRGGNTNDPMKGSAGSGSGVSGSEAFGGAASGATGGSTIPGGVVSGGRVYDGMVSGAESAPVVSDGTDEGAEVPDEAVSAPASNPVVFGGKESSAESSPAVSGDIESDPVSDPMVSGEDESSTESRAAVSGVSQAEKFQILVQRTTRLYDRLKLKVMGQDEAIRLFASGYFQSEVLQEAEKDRKGPSATFLFAGPPGVGKTYLAETAAEILNLPHLRLDMSEYTEQHSSVNRLTGIPKSYQGSRPGVLTEFVKNNPRSVILFDEVEKAHIEVIYQFLQIMDGGSITDSCTMENIDFSNTILIFTTNAGRSLYEDRDRRNLASIPRSVVIKAISEEKDRYGEDAFPAAMCSRFASGNLLMFNYLSVHTLVDIINHNVTEAIEKLRKIYRYEVDLDEKVAPMLLFSQSSSADARNVSSQSVILMKNELFEFGRHIEDMQNDLAGLEKIHFRVELDPENKEIYSLFHNEENTKVLFIGDSDDIDGLPLGDRITLFHADNRGKAQEILAEEEISFILLDLYCGAEQAERRFLSLDDWKSEGVMAFDEITERMPDMPVYIVDKHDIPQVDRTVFLERGAREFIDYRVKESLAFADKITEVADMIYMQKRVDELSGRGRILAYNTAQRFLDDNREAEIVFNDFKIRIAADAAENQMMVSGNDRPTDRFDDVIGAESAKGELKYFVEYLKNPKRFMKKSLKPPKGILFYGPPGTGKTMLARAMAGECDVTFFPATAAGFQRQHVGEGEEYIRNLFATAKKFAPSIIFIDEIDAIGKERSGSTSTHFTELLLNTLLTEMDGFEVNLQKPVFVIAATNYDLDGSHSGKRSLDPALLRRFDNRIYVDLPTEEERELFLNRELAKLDGHTVSASTVHNIAARTTGESIAILKNILELAIRNSAKKGEDLSDEQIMNALEEYMYGEKKEWDEKYYQTVSIHESGHAYICTLSGEKPSYVTIVSRGNFGGYMQHENSEKTPSYTREQLIWKIRTSLAGRAAELEFYGEEGINTGIASDLSAATRIAMDYICRYAMADGQMLSLSPDQMLRTKRGDQMLDQAEKMLEEEMVTTRNLVHEGREKIKALAEFLQKNNQATEEQIASVFGMQTESETP